MNILADLSGKAVKPKKSGSVGNIKLRLKSQLDSKTKIYLAIYPDMITLQMFQKVESG